MKTWLVVLLVFGVNLCFWSLIGAVRGVSELVEHISRRRSRAHHRISTTEIARSGPHHVGVDDVAVLVPAHNEALVIEDTIGTAAALIPAANIFVVSDGSSDDTVALAEACGATVLDIVVPCGKARALKRGIDAFDLKSRFKAVLFLDADTRLDPGYFDAALPQFDDPDVACVAGYATTDWRPGDSTLMRQVLNAHRERVYVTSQLFVKYGQTWKHTDVTPIVPGFASLYRTDILDAIDIDAPGLVIEDFNMTFELRNKHLGHVAFTPEARAYTQDPYRLRDYTRQVRRWSLGFWQTIRRHRLRMTTFSAVLAATIVELVCSSVVIVSTAMASMVMGASDLLGRAADHTPVFSTISMQVHRYYDFRLIAVVFVADYLLTCVVTVIQRRPRYLMLGVLFLPLRLLDSVITLSSIPRAWRVASTGRWKSPQRHGVPKSNAAVSG